MAQIVSSIAPGAHVTPYATGFESSPFQDTINVQSLADEIAYFQLSGYQIIVDDLGFSFEESDVRTIINEGMSRSLLNIAKRSLPRLMLSGVGLTSKDAV